jgi:hypothetical protein
VRAGGVRIPINFHQHKPRWDILLLDDIKACDAQLLQTLPRIGEGRLFEGLYTLGFDMNMNVNHKHVRRIGENGGKLKPRQ